MCSSFCFIQFSSLSNAERNYMKIPFFSLAHSASILIRNVRAYKNYDFFHIALSKCHNDFLYCRRQWTSRLKSWFLTFLSVFNDESENRIAKECQARNVKYFVILYSSEQMTVIKRLIRLFSLSFSSALILTRCGEINRKKGNKYLLITCHVCRSHILEVIVNGRL